MSYSDYHFYVFEFGGLIPEADFEKALVKATKDIDQATSYRIGNLDDWPEFTQKQVRMAECVQAEFIAQYGDVSDFLKAVGSYSIGDVSVSAGKGEEVVSSLSKHYGVTEEAVQFLMPTGLLDRRLR